MAAPLQVRLGNCTSADKKWENKLYLNPADMAQLECKDGDSIIVEDCLVHKVEGDPEMAVGNVGTIKFQRAALNRDPQESIGSFVTARKWGTSDMDFDAPIAHVNVLVDKFNDKKRLELDEASVRAWLERFCMNEVLCPNQYFVCRGAAARGTIYYNLRIISVYIHKDGTSGVGMKNLRQVKYGRLTENSSIDIQASKNPRLTLKYPQGGKRVNLNIDSWNAESMGVGGLDEQFGIIFRRAFASRLYPKDIVAQLGIKHVKGMLLYGPPGTGKTLIARCIGKMLTDNEPKIVNGPEILSKFVGQAEENIRNLFEDARIDMEENGDDADLHIVIFDEIDAICKQRGSVQSGTGVHDTVVNQLLSMIDGVKALNNVLVIGMTNRKDLLDQAMLRPGRLEVHVEISLPDEIGREQIFRIHTKSLRESGHWDEKVSIPELAAKTKNYSGAEIEGVVKSAVSYAFNELLDHDQIRHLDQSVFQDVKITSEIFDMALSEVQPEFGAQEDDLRIRYLGGIYRFSEEVTEVIDTTMNIARRLKESPKMNRAAMLLRGVLGTGKSALACYLAQRCQYPLIRLVSPENYVGWGEAAICQNIATVFDDAYKSPASIVILDDFERLISFIDSDVGSRFSNLILQAILTCLRKQPEIIDRKIFIIVTSTAQPIQSLKIEQFFDYIRDMPIVSSPQEFRNLLDESGLIGNIVPQDVDRIVEAFSGQVGVKDVMTVLEMAQSSDGQITWETFRESWLSKFRGQGDETKLLMF